MISRPDLRKFLAERQAEALEIDDSDAPTVRVLVRLNPREWGPHDPTERLRALVAQLEERQVLGVRWVLRLADGPRVDWNTLL